MKEQYLPRSNGCSHGMNSMHYQLICPVCDSPFIDDGFCLTCPQSHSPALLTTRYSSRTLECEQDASGIYRYQCWLPGTNRLPHASRSVTYQSQKLNSVLGLRNLWIAFSGYWPERGAELQTCTFKELEAYGVLSRIPAGSFCALVVASAGNTAAAFARTCSESDIPCLIIVPESGMKKMLFDNSLKPCVKIACLTEHAGYSDAISLAERVSREDGVVSEGGGRNVE